MRFMENKTILIRLQPMTQLKISSRSPQTPTPPQKSLVSFQFVLSLCTDNPDDGPEPLLFVDVNLGDVSERITVMEGDTADSLTEEFGKKHNLDENMKVKLRTMLQQQIDGILEKIEEEEHTS